MKVNSNTSTGEHSKHRTATSDPIDSHSPRSDTAPKACCHKMGSRNLIVCIDGTANQFGDMNTNVIELYNLILKEVGDNQRTWYNSGIGTYAQPSWKSLNFYKQVLGHTIDLAIAWNFERTIQGAYRWLSDNYEDGDCIFLFGFSRGAFQVRALSGMIDKVGLIHKGNEMQIPFAYELYADPITDKATLTQVGSQKKMCMAERFKRAFSHKDVKVHFVGVWDTVSSIGIMRSKDMLPGTIDGMKHVCYFRHALALDERRVKFLPEYAYGGMASKREDQNVSTPRPHQDNASPTENEDAFDNTLANGPSTKDMDAYAFPEVSHGKESMGRHVHTLEVWFAGTHSDIGGGNVENVAMDRSRPPLRWMVFEAGALGLRMAQFERELSSKEQVEKPHESLSWLWWPLEVFFIRRPTYTRREGRRLITYKPHFGSSRKIHPGQKIHSSLLLTDKTDAQYTPKARPVNDDRLFWQKLREEGQVAKQWLELDMYEYTRGVMKDFISAKCQGVKLQVLRQIAMSRYGRQAVYEKMIEALEGIVELEIKHQLLKSVMDILGKGSQDDSHLKLTPSFKIHPFASDLLKSDNKDYQEIAQELLVEFADPSLLVLDIGTSVRSIGFSPDDRPLVSGSDDKTIQIWDVETGLLVGGPFQGHTSSVMSVAFSLDGRHMVSGSFDRTIRRWDVETGKLLGEPFTGHTDWVRAVAFSPDGRHVVSGSDDRTVRIWNAETGKLVGEPLQGHTDSVSSVAFSCDGRCVVSGSYDTTVRIWDVRTGKLMGEPFKGHTRLIIGSAVVTFVVAFSPDGRHVASGSYDRTVRIWDAKTGKPVGEPFRGHTREITSIAFSPDSMHVVSGSYDKTACILDVKTGNLVGEPLRGHTGGVTSITFSPDGMRVLSGSDDGTVRIWDARTGKQGEPFKGDAISPIA